MKKEIINFEEWLKENPNIEYLMLKAYRDRILRERKVVENKQNYDNKKST